MKDELDTNDDEDAANERGVGEYIDQKTGGELDPKLARKPRLEEIALMSKIGLHEEVSVQECWGETGKAPMSMKIADLNKGTQEALDVRCRLVARDFKPYGRERSGRLVRCNASLGGAGAPIPEGCV